MVKKLREDERIIESIEIDLQILEEGGLIILDVCCPLENLKIADDQINEILNKSIKCLFPNKDIDRAKKLVINNIYFSLELSNQIASSIGNNALWRRHESILQSIKQISYWTSERLNKMIFPLFNPGDSFTLIAIPEN